MKPLRQRLQEARRTLGCEWQVLERDYALSWILAGMADVPQLQDHLVFKGGTALKKCWFGDYRFSEDLDFSALESAPSSTVLEESMLEACRQAELRLQPFANVQILCTRYVEKAPHPENQEAFDLRIRLPWHQRDDARTRIIVEITRIEKILRTPPRKLVLHEYGEPLEAELQVYALEEVLAEKLRALLQHAERLRSRGWGRSRARDYYDIWRILHRYGGALDLINFTAFLHDKCAVRNVQFTSLDDFFEPHLVAHVEKTWDSWLGPLVSELPPYSTVLEDLRRQLAPHVEPRS